MRTLRVLIASTCASASALLFAIGEAQAAVGVLAGLTLIAYVTCDLQTCLLLTIPLALVDPQIVVSGQRLYLDIIFVFLAIPLLKQKFLWRGLVLGPFVIYSVASGALLAINRFWFAAFSLRLLTATIICAAVFSVADKKKILRWLCFSSVPVSIFGLYQMWINDYGDVYFWINRGFFEYDAWRSRAFSIFSTDNVFGGFCAVIVAISFGMVLTDRNKWLLIPFFTSAAGMIASGSRGAWVGCCAALLYLVMKSRPKLIPLYLGLLALLAWISVYFISSDRLNIDQFIIDTRLDVWGAAVILFLGHPLIGVGLTNFAELMPSIIPWSFNVVGAHNIYLQLLSEGGVVGFLALFVPMGFALHKSRSRVAIAGLVATFAHQLVDYLWSDPRYLMAVAVVLGAALFEPSQTAADGVAAP